ncbi:hypothetical protein FDO65_13620 [Nakamurella flava]|uniref:Uncharacterized protein n=1 Tax=Nakamurella flava TaxID=2576308 RepID=A0A4V6CRR8_9ACTN|nr:hypothetical protein [Nakamurella flava]TKV58575.1 hypothetical protein FDO65_13620 [Nakamurella flava]
MYMLVAIAVTVLVIALAWRGIGARAAGQGQSGGGTPGQRPGRTRTLAPDDDPEFLNEIQRKLRGEDKSS